MKLNGKTFKVVFALVIVIGTIFWAVDSIRSRSYSGTNLNANIGNGTVTVTNPSEEPVSMQLVGTGTRAFAVSSVIVGVSGSSTRQGTGRNTTQLFEFELPAGVSQFTVTRGNDVNLAANTDTNLSATVQPLDESATRITLVVATIVVLVALFYISRATDHRWIGIIRRQAPPTPELKAAAESVAGGQGADLRSYGNNHVNTSR